MNAKTAPDHLIFVVREKLSDGSKVYNVVFGDIKLAAITEDDAGELAEIISDAINKHTTNIADTIYE